MPLESQFPCILLLGQLSDTSKLHSFFYYHLWKWANGVYISLTSKKNTPLNIFSTQYSFCFSGWIVCVTFKKVALISTVSCIRIWASNIHFLFHMFFSSAWEIRSESMFTGLLHIYTEKNLNQSEKIKIVFSESLMNFIEYCKMGCTHIIMINTEH